MGDRLLSRHGSQRREEPKTDEAYRPEQEQPSADSFNLQFAIFDFQFSIPDIVGVPCLIAAQLCPICDARHCLNILRNALLNQALWQHSSSDSNVARNLP
jgi:hypothetical protein